MKISYNWLKEYIPVNSVTERVLEHPEKLSQILTSVGLEVENLEKYEEIKDSLKGLVIGEILSCEKHENADKLKVATVDIGNGEPLQIVCGAPNVTSGQKVIVATVGTVLSPFQSERLQINKTKIRGIESFGMICAEDEIGIGESHAGIIVLPPEAKKGTRAFDYYKPYTDWVFEIGLTPNRMDGMSHLGVAKDVCAYVSHHNKADVKTVYPYFKPFKTDSASAGLTVKIENPDLCPRYSGIAISGIKVAPSPVWLQNRLRSIGVRPISNIVDITNFILHETGQPLHSFDADKIKGNMVIVKTLERGTSFITLDGKTRLLNEDDIIICDGNENPLCLGGVFGGLESGVSENTTNIFLESAWFNPVNIRKTSFRHNLRSEAAIRFEKGVDISNTVNVLKRSAQMIKEICGGEITSQVIDQFPFPKPQTEITLHNHYLKKISGKNYHRDTVKGILKSLNFTIIKEGLDELTVGAPFSNPDITLQADVIEEIMRIDGLDNIEIPSSIKMSPAIETGAEEADLKEKVCSWLTGNGFFEIFTNSITNKKYFDDPEEKNIVAIINSLSEDINVMRPSMLPTGLECISYNLNRKNENLLFFEFGKTYTTTGIAKYQENEELAIFFAGNRTESNWKTPAQKIDIYFVKGVCENILTLARVNDFKNSSFVSGNLDDYFSISLGSDIIAEAGIVKKKYLEKFSIKPSVYYLIVHWQTLRAKNQTKPISFREIPKYPNIQRDLSIIVDRSVPYSYLEKSINSLKLRNLSEYRLFDVYESEKIGASKKSLAVSFTFLDSEKTLTDRETDLLMDTIITSIEKNLNAEIRRDN
jgi:phenylalanyl-tRNA synthetase beta chain